MAVINNIVLADGTKPKIGFNEWECEYKEGYPSAFLNIMRSFENNVEAGMYALPICAIEKDEFPQIDGLYKAKPIDADANESSPCITFSIIRDVGLCVISLKDTMSIGVIGYLKKAYYNLSQNEDLLRDNSNLYIFEDSGTIIASLVNPMSLIDFYEHNLRTT